MACGKDIPIRQLARPIDGRSPNGGVPPGYWRLAVNVIGQENGSIRRIPGFRKYGWDSTLFNNQDLHDQLLGKYIDGCGTNPPGCIAPFNVNISGPLEVEAGDGAVFTVTSSGNTAIQWQWSKDGSPILGATTSSYTIPVTTESDSGVYTVVVTNACGSGVSQSFNFTVDAVCVPLTLNSQTPPPGINSYWSGSISVSLDVTVTGTNVTYQWYRGTVPALATAISGADESSYVANRSDWEKWYYCKITDQCGNSALSAPVYILGICPLPTVAPASGTTTNVTLEEESPGVYAPLTLTVVVTFIGSDLSYQWFKGASPLSGETSDTYSVASPTAGDVGTYYCEVTSAACGSRNSGNFVVAL